MYYISSRHTYLTRQHFGQKQRRPLPKKQKGTVTKSSLKKLQEKYQRKNSKCDKRVDWSFWLVNHWVGEFLYMPLIRYHFTPVSYRHSVEPSKTRSSEEFYFLCRPNSTIRVRYDCYFFSACQRNFYTQTLWLNSTAKIQ